MTEVILNCVSADQKKVTYLKFQKKSEYSEYDRQNIDQDHGAELSWHRWRKLMTSTHWQWCSWTDTMGPMSLTTLPLVFTAKRH